MDVSPSAIFINHYSSHAYAHKRASTLCIVSCPYVPLRGQHLKHFINTEFANENNACDVLFCFISISRATIRHSFTTLSTVLVDTSLM